MTETHPVVTRFAPSPTGELHVGGARTALFAWAFARRHGGKFILRVEDTDTKRSSVESLRGILRDLQWLGLDWDEGPDPDAADPTDPASQRGDRGPYFQSQRLDLYRDHIDKLVAAGCAYSRDDEPGVVRFRMDQDVTFTDAVYGEVKWSADQLEDFVILKGPDNADAEGRQFPTFHFAVVLDDALMGVTHVIRGQEHLSNTPKHVALQQALGLPTPVYAHTPSIMNVDGSKMSKRDKAKVARKAAEACGLSHEMLIETARVKLRQAVTDVLVVSLPEPAEIEAFRTGETDDLRIARDIAVALDVKLPEIDVIDFKNAGYLPGVLLNYLALLGWSPGGDRERFDLDFLTREFDLERINKSNAKFDRQKLAAFSAETLREMPATDFTAALHAHMERFHPDSVDKLGDKFATFAAAYQERSETLADPARAGAFFLAADDAITWDFTIKAVRKAMTGSDRLGLTLLAELRDRLDALADDATFGAKAHDAIEALAAEHEVNMGKVAQPVRIAVSGGTVSPPIDQTLALLGKASTLARIDRCLAAAPAE